MCYLTCVTLDGPPHHQPCDFGLGAEVRFPLLRPLLQGGFQSLHVRRLLPWPTELPPTWQWWPLVP